jgi:hypothetical protein
MTRDELAKRVAELSRPACPEDQNETCRCSGNVLRIVADQRDRALALLRELMLNGDCPVEQVRALLAEVGP